MSFLFHGSLFNRPKFTVEREGTGFSLRDDRRAGKSDARKRVTNVTHFKGWGGAEGERQHGGLSNLPLNVTLNACNVDSRGGQSNKINFFFHTSAKKTSCFFSFIFLFINKPVKLNERCIWRPMSSEGDF